MGLLRDMISNNIKKQEEKTLKEQETLQAQKDFEKVRSYLAKKDPELANDLGELDITDMGSETLKNINKMLTKRISPPSPTDELIELGKVGDAITKAQQAGLTVPGIAGMTGQSSDVASRIAGSSKTAPTTGATQPQQVNQPEGDLIPTEYNAMGIPKGFKSKSAMADERQMKADAKKETEIAKSENQSVGVYRFMQQFDRSYKELQAFYPAIGEEGVGGFMTRKGAQIAEALDEFPETKALKIQVLPMANAIAREIEGGRVTDQDRKIYADAFASAINFPTKTNVRNMANQIINLVDKGGNEKGLMAKQLRSLAQSDTDIFKSVIGQVLIEFPEMAKDIYGEDYEVVDED